MNSTFHDWFRQTMAECGVRRRSFRQTLLAISRGYWISTRDFPHRGPWTISCILNLIGRGRWNINMAGYTESVDALLALEYRGWLRRTKFRRMLLRELCASTGMDYRNARFSLWGCACRFDKASNPARYGNAWEDHIFYIEPFTEYTEGEST